MAERITYDFLFALAARSASESETRASVYAIERNRYELEARAFKRMAELIAIFEANEADILELIDNRKARELTRRAEAEKKPRKANG